MTTTSSPRKVGKGAPGQAGAVAESATLSPYPAALSTPSRYLLVPAVLAAAFALRFAMMPADGGYVYIAFVPGVVLLALIAGPWPALLYTAISSVLVMLVFHPAPGLPDHLDDLAGSGFYAVSGVAITFAIHH